MMKQENDKEDEGLGFTYWDDAQVGTHSFSLGWGAVNLYKIKRSISSKPFYVASFWRRWDDEEHFYGAGATPFEALLKARDLWEEINGNKWSNPFNIAIELLPKVE